MNRRPKQPVETVRAWAPWTLLALALAEVGLSIFQWVELRTVQAGGTAVCSVNASINCETVWTSPFAQRLSGLTGLPVAALGLVWGLAAAVCAGALLWRARTRRPVRPAVLPVRTVGAVAALACITLVAGSISAGALCLTCLGTYALVLGYAGVAFAALPGPLQPASGEWTRALGLPATVAAVTWIALFLVAPLASGPARSRGAPGRVAPAPRTSRSSWRAAPSRSARRCRTRWPASRAPRPRRRSTCCPGRG